MGISFFSTLFFFFLLFIPLLLFSLFFPQFDPCFHVNCLQPVDDAAGTKHVGGGSGIWFRNGCPNGTMWQPPPPYLPNSTVQVPGSE